MQFARDRLKSCEPVRRWRKGGALIRLTSQILTQQRLRAFAIADNARKSMISHSMLLGREPINSKWSTDVRFGAHSGLKSDITALPKCATSGLVHSSKSQLLFDHLVPAGEQRRREIEAGGCRLA